MVGSFGISSSSLEGPGSVSSARDLRVLFLLVFRDGVFGFLTLWVGLTSGFFCRFLDFAALVGGGASGSSGSGGVESGFTPRPAQISGMFSSNSVTGGRMRGSSQVTATLS